MLTMETTSTRERAERLLDRLWFEVGGNAGCIDALNRCDAAIGAADLESASAVAALWRYRADSLACGEAFAGCESAPDEELRLSDGSTVCGRCEASQQASVFSPTPVLFWSVEAGAVEKLARTDQIDFGRLEEAIGRIEATLERSIAQAEAAIDLCERLSRERDALASENERLKFEFCVEES